MYVTPLHVILLRVVMPMLTYLFFTFAKIQQFLDRKIGERQDRQGGEPSHEKFFRNFFENFWRQIWRHFHHRFEDSARRVFPENRRNFDFFVAVGFDRSNDLFESWNHFLDEKFAKLLARLAPGFGGRQV